MKVELTIKKEFDVKYLQADCGVRYWEDATVNNTEDTNGDLIPCRHGDSWKPLIDVETGQIINWKKGVVANIHYKVCDNGLYQLLDENKNVVTEIDGYVPDIMCPEGEGYGDYVIMNVDENGFIARWKAKLAEFSYE